MIALHDIQAFADRVAEEFKPRRIILFGSYAYGTPTEDSDADFLIEMPHEGDGVDLAVAIRLRLHPGFPIDLIVRSPAEVKERVRMNDWFIREIVEQGKVLYEAGNGRVGREGRSRLAKRRRRVSRSNSA